MPGNVLGLERMREIPQRDLALELVAVRPGIEQQARPLSVLDRYQGDEKAAERGIVAREGNLNMTEVLARRIEIDRCREDGLW